MLVHIEYVNDYDTTGDGFHRFVDPEDGQEYVYTNFEPYEAHRLYPCFDQPDIKATLPLHRDRAGGVGGHRQLAARRDAR